MSPHLRIAASTFTIKLLGTIYNKINILIKSGLKSLQKLLNFKLIRFRLNG